MAIFETSFFLTKLKNTFDGKTCHSSYQHKHAKWPPIDLTPWTLTLFEVLKILMIGFFKHVQTCFKVLELQHDETL